MEEKLSEKLEMLPEKPGVYLFRDSRGEVIYVGKARSLKHRVRSYFHSPKNLTAKVMAMVRQIDDLETVITDSEVEALILESNLIKKNQPKYNIRLRDDKNYPFLRINLREPWPRLQLVRSTKQDGARYFGPFTSAEAVRETVRVLRSVFPYRTCSDRRLQQGGPPCLYYHIHRCPAPCDNLIEPEAYRARMEEMVQFLDGKQHILIESLQKKMQKAAEDLDFESAAELRNQIQALGQILERQKMVDRLDVEQDVIGLARENGSGCVQIFFVREGKIVGREHFMMQQTDEEPAPAVMTAFLKQYYRDVQDVPPLILLSVPPLEDEAAVLADWLSRKRRRGRVVLHVPERGKKKELVRMVEKNAAWILEEETLKQQRYGAREGMADLRERLDLPGLPTRIECFDISNIQGNQSVASMVVFVEGKPMKSHYRKFHLRTVEGPDDFASMQEVLFRRFRRCRTDPPSHGEEETEAGRTKAHDDSFALLPDLLVIDGGKGQLSAAREVLRHLGLESIPTYGLAKRHEWLFAEGNSNPIELPRNSAGLFLLQRIRDEAHRFALGFHRQSRSKAGFRSLLDDAPGIGAKRRKELLRHFGSLDAIRIAGIDELAAVPSMNRKTAEGLFEFLRGTSADEFRNGE